MPKAVAKRAAASGEKGRRWLEEIDALVSAMEVDWGIRVGEAFDGGTDAFVAPAVQADGSKCVLRLCIPDETATRDMLQANAAFSLADGRGYARLLLEDEGRLACLIERLGTPLGSLDMPITRQLDILCDTLKQAWIVPDPASASAAKLPRGAETTEWFRAFIPSVWERLGKPFSRGAVDRALMYLDACASRMRDSQLFLVHGDANAWNCLEDPLRGGSFRFIDPDGALGEKASDMGVLMIAPEEGFADDPLSVGTNRCRRLTERTGIEAGAIWQWGVIQSVSTALVCLEIDHPAAASLSRIAESWTHVDPFR